MFIKLNTTPAEVADGMFGTITSLSEEVEALEKVISELEDSIESLTSK